MIRPAMFQGWLLLALGTAHGFAGPRLSSPIPTGTSTTTTSSSSSSNGLGRIPTTTLAIKTTPSATTTGYRSSRLWYENDDSSSSSSSSPEANIWSILDQTEKWISTTLASASTDSGGNPYSRKEVNYVCETNPDGPMIAANMFKRLREAREMGEHFGMGEEDRMMDQGDRYRPSTLRQTQVMVIPSNQALSSSFSVFDNFVNAVNTARRNARDYVVDKPMDSSHKKGDDWSVSVNCAHLHPEFGKTTPEETLRQMLQEEAAGEVDVHQQEMNERRTAARQSPYPTVVVEVRAQPPPDWGASSTSTSGRTTSSTSFLDSAKTHPRASIQNQDDQEDDDDDDDDDDDEDNGAVFNRKQFLKKDITPSDREMLEALFGKAAATEKNVDGGDGIKERRRQQEDDFYAAISNSLESVSSISPMRQAQEWIRDHDPKFEPTTSAFTESDTTEIDHAYEFVFTNMAMQKEQARMDNQQGSDARRRRQYLVMSQFLATSATSLEKFTTEVMNIVRTLPDLHDRVQVSHFHPEHVQEERRSAMPIVCLQWTSNMP